MAYGDSFLGPFAAGFLPAVSVHPDLAALAHVQKERIAVCMTALVFGIGEGLNLSVGQLARGPLVGKIFGCPAPEAGLPTSLPTKQVSTQRLSPFFSRRKKARDPWRIAGLWFLIGFRRS